MLMDPALRNRAFNRAPSVLTRPTQGAPHNPATDDQPAAQQPQSVRPVPPVPQMPTVAPPVQPQQPAVQPVAQQPAVQPVIQPPAQAPAQPTVQQPAAVQPVAQPKAYSAPNLTPFFTDDNVSPLTPAVPEAAPSSPVDARAAIAATGAAQRPDTSAFVPSETGAAVDPYTPPPLVPSPVQPVAAEPVQPAQSAVQPAVQPQGSLGGVGGAMTGGAVAAIKQAQSAPSAQPVGSGLRALAGVLPSASGGVGSGLRTLAGMRPSAAGGVQSPAQLPPAAALPSLPDEVMGGALPGVERIDPNDDLRSASILPANNDRASSLTAITDMALGKLPTSAGREDKALTLGEQYRQTLTPTDVEGGDSVLPGTSARAASYGGKTDVLADDVIAQKHGDVARGYRDEFGRALSPTEVDAGESVNPTDSARVGETSGLAQNAIKAIGSGPSRSELAKSRFDTFAQETDPAYQQAIRLATEKGAAHGGLGSGRLTNTYGDLATSRMRDLDVNRQKFLTDALEGDIGDRYTNASTLTAAEQAQRGTEAAARGESRTERGFRTDVATGNVNRAQDAKALALTAAENATNADYGEGLNRLSAISGLEDKVLGQGASDRAEVRGERDYTTGLDERNVARGSAAALAGTQFGENATDAALELPYRNLTALDAVGSRATADARADRAEVRGERGYQVDQDNQAFGRARQGLFDEDALVDSAHGRSLQDAGFAYGGNPSAEQLLASGQASGEAQSAGATAADILQNATLRDILTQQNAAGGGAAGTPTSAPGGQVTLEDLIAQMLKKQGAGAAETPGTYGGY